MAIKAIIFDCFGVLATDGWLPFRDHYFGSDPDLYEKAVASNKRVDAGLHSYDDFINEVASMAGVTSHDARQTIENNVPNTQMLEYIRDDLKSRYKLGFLSNAGANWLDDIFEPWQVQLFDEVLLSYQIGVIKPDPIMYETIAARLGVLSEECLFIDDQPRYCEGAEAVGMRTILYTDTPHTLAKLEGLLRA
jgi:HAD superfamily hydrolase (TIGR01509 family)